MENTQEGVRNRKRTSQTAALTTGGDAESWLRITATHEKAIWVPVHHRRKIVSLNLPVPTVGVGLDVGLGMIILSSSSPPAVLSAKSGLVCPSQEETASALHRTLEQRDHVLEPCDLLGLEKVVGEALLE